MKVRITDEGLMILPENKRWTALELAFIEERLGLRKDGDIVDLVRHN